LISGLAQVPEKKIQIRHPLLQKRDRILINTTALARCRTSNAYPNCFNSFPRIRMLDGFNEGWIDFEHGEAGSLKGNVALETV
jgi:hypothetical protein